MFVVTGGGSGMGLTLAHALAVRGKKVLIVGRRQALLDQTASFSSLISTCCADVSTGEGRKEIMTHLQQVEQLEGLIHNAGTMPIQPISTIDETSWQQAIATNLNAPLFLSQLLLDKLIDGRVLNIGSGVAYFPVVGWSAYCVSKAALSMLTRCWQLEYQQTAFTSVMPGIIDTDMQALIRKADHMEVAQRDFYRNLHTQNRLITTETVATFLIWLLLDISKAEYVAREWDIYDTSHHHYWLTSPHAVPHWE